MTWKRFPRYWPFVRENHQSLVDSTHKGSVIRRALMIFLLAWISRIGQTMELPANWDAIVPTRRHWNGNDNPAIGHTFVKLSYTIACLSILWGVEDPNWGQEWQPKDNQPVNGIGKSFVNNLGLFVMSVFSRDMILLIRTWIEFLGVWSFVTVQLLVNTVSSSERVLIQEVYPRVCTLPFHWTCVTCYKKIATVSGTFITMT